MGHCIHIARDLSLFRSCGIPRQISPYSSSLLAELYFPRKPTILGIQPIGKTLDEFRRHGQTEIHSTSTWQMMWHQQLGALSSSNCAIRIYPKESNVHHSRATGILFTMQEICGQRPRNGKSCSRWYKVSWALIPQAFPLLWA